MVRSDNGYEHGHETHRHGVGKVEVGRVGHNPDGQRIALSNHVGDSGGNKAERTNKQQRSHSNHGLFDRAQVALLIHLLGDRAEVAVKEVFEFIECSHLLGGVFHSSSFLGVVCQDGPIRQQPRGPCRPSSLQ